MKTKDISVPLTRSKVRKVVKSSDSFKNVSKRTLRWTKQAKIQSLAPCGQKKMKKMVLNKIQEVHQEKKSQILRPAEEAKIKEANTKLDKISKYKKSKSVDIKNIPPFVKKTNESASEDSIQESGSEAKAEESSQENANCCSSKDGNKECLQESVSSNSSKTAENEPKANISNFDEEQQEASLSESSDADDMFDSENSDISVGEFKVTHKDHKYNTRNIDPKKSYKKLLPRLMNEKKKGKIKSQKCSICSQSFLSSESLQIHLAEHKKESGNEYQCDKCTKIFHSESKLETHKLIHTRDRPYTCTDCELTFTSEDKLNVHNRIHTGEKPYRCDYCLKEFRCRTQLKHHKQLHRSSKDYRCSICDRGFHIEKCLKKHMDNAQIQTCHICKKSFCSAPQLNSHVKEHGEDYPYPCKLCKKKFKVQSNYLLHCKIQHNIGEALSTRKYTCELCPSSFYKQRQMTLHMETVHSKSKDSAPLICPWNHCSRKFTSEKRLSIHVRSHNGEKSYLCYKCGVNFKDYVYFRKHRARCLQKRKGAFVCDTCGTVLTEMGSLRVHKRIHTGEKPYQCDLCGTWFRTPSHLSRHRLIHLRNKDKPVRRRVKKETSFVVKTEKQEDEEDSMVPVVSGHNSQLEFIGTTVESADRKPVFDSTGVQTMSTTDVSELLFASQIVQEVMATTQIKKEPNETHYIVISQQPNVNNENEQITYMTEQQCGLLPDDQITYITQDSISDDHYFITQGQEIISSDGQITYVSESDTASSEFKNVIPETHEMKKVSINNENIMFTLTPSEQDHTQYVVVNSVGNDK